MFLNQMQSEFSFRCSEDHSSDFGLNVISVGYKSILKNEKIARLNRFKDYKCKYKKGRVSEVHKLVYITKGSGFLHFEGIDEIEISQGMVLVILPNQHYEYQHDIQSEWKEYYIRFEANPACVRLINALFDDNNQVVNMGFNEDVIKIFDRMIEVLKNDMKSSQVFLSGMLLYFLGLSFSKSKNGAVERNEVKMIEKAKLIMSENLMKPITLNEIALELNISYSSFRKKFKKHTGHSPAKYSSILRINKAKQLLIESNYSIKEISYMLKFSSVEHFSTNFRKSIGFAPKSFRLMN